MILTGASKDALTRWGSVDRHEVVDVLWSSVQVRGIPAPAPVLFPTAENFMLAPSRSAFLYKSKGQGEEEDEGVPTACSEWRRCRTMSR